MLVDGENEESSIDELIGGAIDEVNASADDSSGEESSEDTETTDEDATEEETEDEDAEEDSAEEDEETEEDDAEEDEEDETEETTQKKPSRAQRRIQKLVEKNANTERQLELANQMLTQQQQLNADTDRRFKEVEAKLSDKSKSEPPQGHTKVGDRYIPNKLVERFDDIDDPKTVEAILAIYDHVAPQNPSLGKDHVSEIVQSNMDQERRVQAYQQQMDSAEAKAYKAYPHLFQDTALTNGKVLFNEKVLPVAQELIKPYNVFDQNSGKYLGNKIANEPGGIDIICKALSVDKVAIDVQNKAKKRLTKAKKQRVTPTKSGGGSKSKSSNEDQSIDDMLKEGWDKI